MGVIAKSKTSKRVAALEGPVSDSLALTPWTADGLVSIGRLVRSAAMSVSLGDLTSSTVRGRQSVIASALTSSVNTGASVTWIELVGSAVYRVSIGVPKTNDSAARDWV